MNEIFNLKIEQVLLAEELPLILDLAKKSRFFYDYEVKVLRDLCEEHLSAGEDSNYFFHLIKESGSILGFACYGKIEEAENNYDLYWMAVDPMEQGKGLGKLLVQAVEVDVQKFGGRQINIETSSRELYFPTRKFYEGQGYIQSASLPDYYAIGDHKICYYKNLN